MLQRTNKDIASVACSPIGDRAYNLQVILDTVS
jgi:hypothetical protein